MSDTPGNEDQGPSGSPPWMTVKTPGQRKQMLAQAVANHLARGNMRVESQTDFNAVLVEGKPVNHTFHLILTLVTCLLWAPVWIVVAMTQGEKRHMVAVDEYGNAQLQRL